MKALDIEEILDKELGKNSVFVNVDFLSPHYIPETLPHRNKEIERVTRILASALKGQKPNNVFIYGKTGTGKTSVAKKVLQTIEAYGQKQNMSVHTSYINCRITNSKYGIFVKLAKVLNPDESLQGFSTTYLYEKIKSGIESKSTQFILILDELDKIKDIDDAVYALTRMNDELERGGLTIVGISNVINFKDRLDARTKSTLCQEEIVFAPYNADELREILESRAKIGFKEGAISTAAINLAAAIASQESGDARIALLLLSRAGNLADELGDKVVTDEHVRLSKEKVEEDIILHMISTLPLHQQMIVYAMARLINSHKGYQKLDGRIEKDKLFSGEIYDEYCKVAAICGKEPNSDRWYREYIRELALYGIISINESGKGIRGHTHLISLNYDAKRTEEVLAKTLGIQN